MTLTAELNTLEKDYEKIFNDEFLPHADALYNFAYYLVYNEDDANDLVQETFMKAFRFVDKYEVGSNARAWLFKILKNGFINQYRKKSKRPTEVDFEDITNFHDGDSDSNLAGFEDLRTEMFEHMLGDEVTNAINSLSLPYRTVVLLADIEGFTYKEIAAIMNIELGTVRSRLNRARNLLKNRLNGYAEDLGYKDKRRKAEEE